MRVQLPDALSPIAAVPMEGSCDRCGCGAAGLGLGCRACAREVCAFCAAFVDPATGLTTRPSRLLADGYRRGFLMHRACLHPEAGDAEQLAASEVRLLVGILRAQDAWGRPPRPGFTMRIRPPRRHAVGLGSRP